MSSNGEKPDLKDLRERLAGIERGALTLQLHEAAAAVDAPRATLARKLEALARALAATTGDAIAVQQGCGAEVAATPALTLASSGGRTVDYLALPEGPERAPFGDALLALGRSPSPPAEPWARRLALLERPAELLVFVGAACPHCPAAVAAAIQLAAASAQVRVSIVDAQLYSELAEQLQVRSVPTIILDREMTTVGALSAEELAEQVLGRGSDEFDARVLRSLVEAGRIADVAEALGSRWASAFCAAWRASTTSLRMGLLLAAEEALARDPAALDDLVSDLVPSLSSHDAALRGDTADLLGRIGHPAAAEPLNQLLADRNGDVADAAADAIEAIAQRTASSEKKQ